MTEGFVCDLRPLWILSSNCGVAHIPRKSCSEASSANSCRLFFFFLKPCQFLPNLFYFILGPLLLDKGLEPGWLGFKLTKRNPFIVNINGKLRFLQGLGLAAWADQKQLGLISQYSLELRQLTAILLLTKQHKNVRYKNVNVSLSARVFTCVPHVRIDYIWALNLSWALKETSLRKCVSRVSSLQCHEPVSECAFHTCLSGWVRIRQTEVPPGNLGTPSLQLMIDNQPLGHSVILLLQTPPALSDLLSN